MMSCCWAAGQWQNRAAALVGQACAESDTALDVVSLAASAIPSQQALFGALAPRRWLFKLLPRKVGIAAVGSAEWVSPDGPGSLAEMLIARCRRRPLAVLLDEAHTLDPKVGNVLLNASQQVRVSEAPFLLVLAGTPGLPAHLDVDATVAAALVEAVRPAVAARLANYYQRRFTD